MAYTKGGSIKYTSINRVTSYLLRFLLISFLLLQLLQMSFRLLHLLLLLFLFQLFHPFPLQIHQLSSPLLFLSQPIIIINTFLLKIIFFKLVVHKIRQSEVKHICFLFIVPSAYSFGEEGLILKSFCFGSES